MQIYQRARAAMAAAGNPTQWGDTYPDAALVQEDILANRQFVVMTNGQLEGTFAFILGSDPTYAHIEGAWLDDARPYGTIHRLAAAAESTHVADRVLTWAMEHCDSLRIDTHTANRVMQHVLDKNGFARCGTILTDDGTPRMAYQKLKG